MVHFDFETKMSILGFQLILKTILALVKFHAHRENGRRSLRVSRPLGPHLGGRHPHPPRPPGPQDPLRRQDPRGLQHLRQRLFRTGDTRVVVPPQRFPVPGMPQNKKKNVLKAH